MMKGAIGYPNSASERAGWDGKMLLDTFQQEIDNLVARMLDLGRQVEVSLENMVGAMEERDAELAGKELGVDARYKARGADIDNRTMVLQARWAPVARDLSLSRLFMMGVQEQPGTLSTLPYTFPFP
jgi:phosphate uptake regulator